MHKLSDYNIYSLYNFDVSTLEHLLAAVWQTGILFSFKFFLEKSN